MLSSEAGGRRPVVARRILRRWALPEEDLAQRMGALGDADLHRGRAQFASAAQGTTEVSLASVGTERAPRSRSYPDLPSSPLPYFPKYRVPRRFPFVLSFFASIMRMIGSASSLVFLPSALPICSTDWPGFLAT